MSIKEKLAVAMFGFEIKLVVTRVNCSVNMNWSYRDLKPEMEKPSTAGTENSIP